MNKNKPEKTYLSSSKQKQQQFEQDNEYFTPDQLNQNAKEEESLEIENYTFHQTKETHIQYHTQSFHQIRYTDVHYHIQSSEKQAQRPENSNSDETMRERSNSRSKSINTKTTQLKENNTTRIDNKKQKKTRPRILHSRPPLNQVKQYF